MEKILIVYASTDGQTAKIASRIADTLRAAGRTVEVSDIHGGAPSLKDASAILIGASLRFGKYQKEIEAFARKNRVAIDQLPNAFFAVSMSAARQAPRSQAEVVGSIDRFVQLTGWTPRQRVPFGGAAAGPEIGV